MSARILIVDDETTLSLFLQRYLAALCPGHTIDTAATAADALACLARDRYDLVLVDYLLPDANGFTVLRQAQCQMPTAATILMTGCPSPALERATREMGAAWLPKPFDLRDLGRLVSDRLVGRPGTRPASDTAFAAD